MTLNYDDLIKDKALEIKDIVDTATKQLNDNKDTFIAKWLLDNPDENPKDWMMCYQPVFSGNGEYYKFWMQESLHSGEYVTVDKDEFRKLITLVMETSKDEETFKVAKQLMFKHLGKQTGER